MVSKRSRARDYDEIKTAEDILYRWSRPQRNSTFVPNQRDWRYETGVYQHQDFDNSKGDKTIWDMLDEDNENGVFGRERRRKKGGKANSKMNNGETEGYGREEAGAVELGISTGSVTPARSHIDTVTPASTWKNKETASPPNKSNTFRTLSPKLYGRAADYTESNGEEEWEQTGFLVRLHFPRKKSSLSAILNRFPPQCALSSEPNTPVTPSKLFTPADSHDRGKIDSLRLFHREWRDKTLNFCMRNVLGLLHHPEKLADSIPASFQWWDGAVPVDAILPPGIAMSAKELNVSSTRGKSPSPIMPKMPLSRVF
jgi:hypothetical protein